MSVPLLSLALPVAATAGQAGASTPTPAPSAIAIAPRRHTPVLFCCPEVISQVWDGSIWTLPVVRTLVKTVR